MWVLNSEKQASRTVVTRSRVLVCQKNRDWKPFPTWSSYSKWKKDVQEESVGSISKVGATWRVTCSMWLNTFWAFFLQLIGLFSFLRSAFPFCNCLLVLVQFFAVRHKNLNIWAGAFRLRATPLLLGEKQGIMFKVFKFSCKRNTIWKPNWHGE